jgi:ABC transport system ATP-binding/permease protein
VTSVIAFEGDGKWQEYAGGYQDWARNRGNAQAKPEKKPAEAPKAKPAPAEKPVQKVKLSFKENRELETLPGQIGALEKEQKDIGAKLADGELYRTNPEEVKRLQARYDQIDELLLTSLARWEELEAKSAG